MHAASLNLLLAFGSASMAATGGCKPAVIESVDPSPVEQLPLLNCESDSGRVRCTRERVYSGTGGPDRVHLGISGDDLLHATAFGWNMCAISKKHGYRCHDFTDQAQTHARAPERMEHRAVVSWDRGICVEMRREHHLSAFECFVKSAGTRHQTEFWIASEHQSVTFPSGACFCRDSRKMLASPDKVVPAGAVCTLTGEDVPLERRDFGTDHALQVVLVRDAWGRSGEFADVCDRIREALDEDPPTDPARMIHERPTASGARTTSQR